MCSLILYFVFNSFCLKLSSLKGVRQKNIPKTKSSFNPITDIVNFIFPDIYYYICSRIVPTCTFLEFLPPISTEIDVFSHHTVTASISVVNFSVNKTSYRARRSWDHSVRGYWTSVKLISPLLSGRPPPLTIFHIMLFQPVQYTFSHFIHIAVCVLLLVFR